MHLCLSGRGANPCRAALLSGVCPACTKAQCKKLDVHFAIQTNGTLIDREWAGFLAQNGFLTGLSLDGTKEVNDRFRVDAQGGGTYTKVLHAAQLFDAAGAQYNILTTVTSAVAENVERIYRFLKERISVAAVHRLS